MTQIIDIDGIGDLEREIRRSKLVRLVERLPDAMATPVRGQRHRSLVVRRRRFGWLLDNHHGDGRLALNVRAPVGANRLLVSASPDRFYLPRYLGHRGWVGAWLDLDEVDWAAIDAIMVDAYRMTAPKALLPALWEAE
jgi:hypothetical protein